MIIYAHRGNSSKYPENTMLAFESAIALGADGIETDVHLTKDGVLVITHDEEISRVSTGKGMIKDLTLEELRQYDFGSFKGEEFSGQLIPTLDDLLDLVEDNDVLLNIEIKMGFILYPGLEEKLYKKIKERGFMDRTIFSSFNHYSLAMLKEIDPTVKTGALYQSGLYEAHNYAKTFGANALHPYYMAFDASLLKDCHDNNLKVNLWTVNNANQAKAFLDMGIDGVITDYPEELINELRRK
ncbi:MAG: glycerophosphodiester phosphodiesterase [Clostridium sp.]|jgi:glycerophosphoryl diester phosphodiesterase|nr:glycerophosphodiester phosphodiesterase [Clostridium sp.]